MKIGFSVRAWVLSAAAGLVIAGTLTSTKAPMAKTAAAQTQADNEASSKPRPEHSSLKSYLSRHRRTNSQIEAESLGRDSGVRQVSGEVVSADGSASGEPRKLIERPAVRDAISKSRPARTSLFPSLFKRPGRHEPQQQVVAPRSEDGRSAVQQRLEELYRQNGQEMPPMDLGALPESDIEQEIPPLPKVSSNPEPIRQVSNNPFKRFFTKISPFRRKAAGDERPEHVEKMPAAVRQEQQRVHQNFNSLPAPVPDLPSSEPQRLSEESQREAIQAIDAPAADLPEFQPAVALPEVGTQPDAENLTADSRPDNDLAGGAPNPEIPTLDDIPSIDDVLGNPFPEVSEAEADSVEAAPMPKEETPFSGLALEADPAPIDPPALPDSVTDEAPSLPELPSFGPAETDADADDAVAVPKLPEVSSLPEPDALPLPGEDTDAEQAPELPEIKPAKTDPRADTEAKLQKIAERQELKGLKGFCPVILRDKRDLVDAVPQFSFEFEGRTYNFSSAEALEKFQADPELYAPANAGFDVVAGQDNVEIEGTLDHAVWYKNRLFLFSSQQTLDQFSIAPSVYVPESNDTAAE